MPENNDPWKGIRDVQVRRIAERGGVKRMAVDVYPEVRTVMDDFLRTLLGDAIAYTELARRSTIHPEDVLHALRKRGRIFYDTDDATGTGGWGQSRKRPSGERK